MRVIADENSVLPECTMTFANSESNDVLVLYPA